MKIAISILIIFGIIVSCEKTLDGGADLIGSWLVLQDCDSCAMFEFETKNNLIIHDLIENKSSSHDYRLLHDNIIQISYGDRKDRYDIKTHSIDTIEIIGFSLSTVPEEMNTLLKRIHK